MSFNRIKKEDVDDIDFINSYELYSDGYGTNSIYLSTTCVSTTSGTQTVVINLASDGQGIFYSLDHSAQPGDIVWISGTSGASGDGYFTINTIVDDLTFTINETFGSSTGGNVRFQYKSGASNIGYDSRGDSVIAHNNIQDALKAIDSSVSILSVLPADSFIGNITGGSAPAANVSLLSIDSTSVIYDVVSHTFQRAALTGAVTSSLDSNTTAFGVLSALSVLANATNASAVPSALAGTTAFQHLRVNAAGTGLEWSVFTAGDFPAGIVPLTTLATQATDTFIANVSGSTATPIAVNLSTLAGTGLVFGTHTLDVTAGAGGSIVVGANDVQRAALTGDVTASQDSNATTIAANAVTNAKLATMLTDTFKANVSGSTAVPTDVSLSTLAGAGLVFGTHTLDVTAGAGGSLIVGANDIQRAALTGAIVASQDSNATTFGVLAAKSVLANSTNSSAVPAALAGSAAFQHLRVNSANNALEWSLLTAGDFPAGIVPVTGVSPGTSGQVLMSNATPVATWTTLTGDVVVGATGVTAISSGVIIDSDVNASAAIAVSKLAAGIAGQVLMNNSTPTPTYTTISGDVTLSNAGAAAVTDITGASGFVDISSVGNIIRWATATTAPGIIQSDNITNSATAAAMTIQAANATGTTSTGGTLILSSGTGTSFNGQVKLQLGGSDRVTLTSNVFSITAPLTTFKDNTTATTLTISNNAASSTQIQFVNTCIPTILQSDITTNSATGNTFTIQGQNATGTTATGGTLDLISGTGTTAAGPVRIRTGGTTRLTANATGVITIANLSTGLVHADSSGNLTSSLLVDADITIATIALTKIATQATDTFLANVSGSTASPSAINISTLAGAGLVFGTHTLDVTAGAGASLVVSANDIQRAALTGDVTASQDSNATTIAANVVSNSKLAQMVNDTFKGNVSGSTADPSDINLSTLAGSGLGFSSHTLNVNVSTSLVISTDNVVRAALTGDITAAQDSNTTAFRSFSAKSVLANATNAAGVPSDLAGSAAFQHLRVNSANTGLEWSIFTAGDFPASIIPLTALATQATDTFIANVTAGTATPVAVNISTLAGAGLVFGSHTLDVTAGAGGSLIVSANDIQRAALTGAITASQDSNTTSLATVLTDTFLANVSGSTASPSATNISSLAGAGLVFGTHTLDVTAGAGASLVVSANDIQRGALTGAITASQDSNTTAFGVLAAKSVLANATNSSAVPAALAGSAAFQHLRVNSANTGLEWSLFTAGDFPAAVVPLTALATQATHTFVANNTGSTATPTAITATQATAELDLFSSTLKGLTPLSGGGTTNFLRADGTWAVPVAALPSVATDTFLGNISGSPATAAAVLLSALSSTTIIYDAASHTFQEAAITGAVTSAQNSSVTAFGVLAAKSVLSNATNASAIPAALSGSAAFQHLRVNSANTGLEWSLFTSGDFPASVIPVTSLASGTAGQVLMNNSTPTPAYTTISGDSTLSSTGSMANISLTGSSGSVSIASTGNILTWVTATTAPGIKQTDNTTNSATAATMTFQAANATGTTATGGALVLTSGTGTTVAGNTNIQTGGVTKVSVNPTFSSFHGTAGTEAFRITPSSAGATSLQAAVGVTSFTINQADNVTNSATAATTTLQAANATGTTATGGTLSLTSGTGTTAAGPVLIRTGGTTRLTANATGVITIANLSTGIVHADSSGNLTSSLIVNADVNASAAIAYSKLNLATSIVNADIAAAAAIAVSKLAAGTAGQVLMNNSTPTPTYTTISGDSTLTSAGAMANVSLTGSGGFVSVASTGNIIRWVTATTAPGISQADNITNSATAAAMTIQAANATGTTATGGTLALTSGTGTTAAGPVLIRTGGTTRLTANATGVITIANLSTGLVHADSSGNLTSSLLVNADIAATGVANIAVNKLAPGTAGQLLLNNSTPAATWTTMSGDSTLSSAGAMANISLTGSGGFVDIASTGNVIRWATATTAPGIMQTNNTTNSATAAAMTIQAQNATGTTATGGDLDLRSGTGTTAAGDTIIRTGGSTRISIPGATNLILFNNSSGNLGLTLETSTATPKLLFATTATTPTITQTDKTTNGASGFPLLIQAQNETGTTSNGGILDLRSGTGTSNDGNLTLRNGSTVGATLSSSSSNFLIASGYNLVVTEGGTKPNNNAGQGAWWVRNDTPCAPFFVDDTDVIVPIRNGTGAQTTQTTITAAVTTLQFGSYVIPANTLYVGASYRLTSVFQFFRGATATALTITYTFNNGNGTDLAVTVATPTATAGYVGTINMYITITAIGASGVFIGVMHVNGDALTTGNAGGFLNTGAIDTTTNNTILLQMNMNTAVTNTQIISYSTTITQLT